jgi:hypothetical protein
VTGVQQLWTAMVVLVLLAVAGLVVAAVLGRGGRADRRAAGAAAVEVEGLFAPARRHTAEYFHAVEMRREEVASPDGDGPDRLRAAVRRAVDDAPTPSRTTLW